MKRRALLDHLRAHGCELLRDYWNPANSKTSAVPWHSASANLLARKICQDLGVPPP